MKKYILSSLCFLAFGCSRNNEVSSVKKPHGLWLLSEAKRDGAPTKTLRGLFLDFGDSVITSNFTGDTLTGSYKYDADQQTINYFIRDTLTYRIKHFSDTLLDMEADIRGIPFEFSFVRNESL